MSELDPTIGPEPPIYDDGDYLKQSAAITVSIVILVVNTVTLFGNSLVIAAFIQVCNSWAFHTMQL